MPQNKQKSKVKSKAGCSSDDDSEHELFYYADNRVKLMKQVLKLIKPKKIKSIAPDFLKNLDIEEINSMLLEELLGISNKRLKHILNGENVDAESSSSESEEEKPVDIISLDDISDSDDEFGLGSVNVENKEVSKKNKEEDKHKHKKVPKPIKEEKLDKPSKSDKSKKKTSNTPDKGNSESESDKLMSVLEILELQARARAIRSQLALESVNKKQMEASVRVNIKKESSDDSDAVVVDSPKNEEIVITSSESENDCPKADKSIDVCEKRCNKGHSASKESTSEANEFIRHKKRKCRVIAVPKQAVAGKSYENPVEGEIVQTDQNQADQVLNLIEKENNSKQKGENHKENESTSTEGNKSNEVISDLIDTKQIEQSTAQEKIHDKSDSDNDDVINLDIEEI